MRWLGRMGYARALDLQDALVIARRRGQVRDTLLLLEHPPVVTLGRGGGRKHLLRRAEELADLGIELHETGRGGDVTYHGPGQLVGYPVIALEASRRDAHRYLRDLERALMLALAGYGIEARRESGLTGVWVGEDKLAAIGVRLSAGWITSHGFALNVGADVGGFSHIVPCGIAGRGVTSVARLLGYEPPLPEVAGRVARQLAEVLERRAVAAEDEAERLELELPQPSGASRS